LKKKTFFDGVISLIAPHKSAASMKVRKAQQFKSQQKTEKKTKKKFDR
jgi:hypothetical protein